jgi:3-phenylpropionate/cinnamic acid dioxygenase small subunit
MSVIASVDAAQLAGFVYDEARMIDERRFEEWFDLFLDDGRYWMPLTRGQPDGENHTSLFFEDKLLLRVRIDRLKNPRSFSQQPPSYCQHVLQQPTIELVDAEDNRYVTRTAFLYVETRQDKQLVLAGTAWHHLSLQEAKLRIRLKKVELVNCDAAFPEIQLFP